MELFRFDDDYVRRLRECDSAVVRHFHDYFRDLLRATFSRRLHTTDVDDLIQETFARVFTRLGDLHEGAKLGAFVYGVAGHVAQEQSRANSRSQPLEAVRESAVLPDVEERVDRSRAAAEVRRLLAELPRRDSDILQAVFLQEEDKDAVCERYGVTRANLRVLIHRAVKSMRQSLER
ncbi:MAG TPA: sigma-70 family RNA polymerase sigma factor [Thermoanaerobaculia bacterium]|jgi:RNA polymerase sigma-70 factor (ECF subfamily)